MMNTIDTAKPLRIDEIYAFVAKHPNGDEGVMAFLATTGVYMPMVAADVDRVRSLVPVARNIARQAGVTFTIRRFTMMTDVTSHFMEAP